MAKAKAFSREASRPKCITPKAWSDWIDTVSTRGGVPFTEEGLLQDFRRCCPEYSGVNRLRELSDVHFCHWRWYWERWHLRR